MSTTLNDVKGILQDEMGFCPKCHDHTPCGCENEDEDEITSCLACGSGSTSTEMLMNRNTCWNCDSPLTD